MTEAKRCSACQSLVLFNASSRHVGFRKLSLYSSTVSYENTLPVCPPFLSYISDLVLLLVNEFIALAEGRLVRLLSFSLFDHSSASMFCLAVFTSPTKNTLLQERKKNS